MPSQTVPRNHPVTGDDEIPEEESVAFDDQDESTSFVIRGVGFARFNPQTAWLAHPLIWMAIGTAMFLVAWLFPPDLYQQLFVDTDFMFLHQKMFLFNAGCIGLGVLGVWVGMGGTFSSGSAMPVARSRIEQSPATATGVLISLCFLNLASIAFYARVGGLAALKQALTMGDAFQRLNRQIVEATGNRWWLTLLLFSLAFSPVVYQMYRSPSRTKWTKILCWCFVVTYVVAAIVTMRRNMIARPLFGMLLCYLVWPGNRKLTAGKAIYRMFLLFLGMVGFFLVATLIRKGLGGAQEGVTEVIRYLIVPYNTQPLIIDGSLVYEGGGTGYFWMQWFWSFPGLDQLLGLQEFFAEHFGEPPPYGAYERAPILAEVGITTGTALPTFAGAFVDLGWFGMMPFFLVGAVTGWLWRGFLRGAVLATMLFPMASYACMEWRTNIGFPNERMCYALVLFAAIAFSAAIERSLRR